MPITRTVMIDDDGSGTTGTIINNAWKQELYGQIDALAGTAMQTWTPVDASGAGLALTAGGCGYARAGSAIFVIGGITYPTTANGARARFGGLPLANGPLQAGFYVVSAPQAYQITIIGGDTSPYINSPVGGVMTNAQMSGIFFIFAGFYLV